MSKKDETKKQLHPRYARVATLIGNGFTWPKGSTVHENGRDDLGWDFTIQIPGRRTIKLNVPAVGLDLYDRYAHQNRIAEAIADRLRPLFSN